jgi:hypothetical protein
MQDGRPFFLHESPDQHEPEKAGAVTRISGIYVSEPDLPGKNRRNIFVRVSILITEFFSAQ